MPARDGDTYTLRLGRGPKLFVVETVVSPQALQKGLSGRKKAPAAGHGMLFVFPDLAKQSMWMPDMAFPLDIVWLDENLTVVHITEGATPCPSRDACPHHSSRFMVKYAIEMSAGQAGLYGFLPGVQLSVVS
jgi:uncharacterized membrane protein (UPF0127 family)